MEKEIIDVKLTEKDEEKERRKIDWEGFLEKNKYSLGSLVLGLLLIGAGFLSYRMWQYSGPKVEILGEETAPEGSKIVVEIAGEVMSPGVYELSPGGRVKDLLTMAGGLTAAADRGWVEKNINLAAKLADGAKIYIPGITNLSNSSNLSNKININTASEAELDTLWGVGPATAKKIVSGRPYQRPEELLEKKIIKSNVWETIKDQITVF